MKNVTLAAVLALSLASPVAAQNDVCRDQNGNVDQTASAGWQNFQANASAIAMQKLVGIWYVEIPNQVNPAQVAYRYTTFESNGLFTTQTRVCAGGYCSDYPGHGFWASQGQGDDIATMSIFSDTQVTNYCSITQMRFSGSDSFQDQYGYVSQRAR